MPAVVQNASEEDDSDSDEERDDELGTGLEAEIGAGRRGRGRNRIESDDESEGEGVGGAKRRCQELPTGAASCHWHILSQQPAQLALRWSRLSTPRGGPRPRLPRAGPTLPPPPVFVKAAFTISQASR